MKLLFDHNLSPRLVKKLEDLYPQSTHVSFHALAEVDDAVVREFAGVNG